MSEVAIVATGIANLASVQSGLRRVGAEPVVVSDAESVSSATHVLLPGVGAFGSAMERLGGALGAAIRERIAADRPTLAVCLGLQLLCESSEESPGVAGLSVLAASVSGYPETVTVPQMGWARIAAGNGCRLLQSGYAYFANSYRVVGAVSGWSVATGEHAGEYVAAVERGRVLACQFHPELSGQWGLDLLRRWLCPP